MEVRSGDIGVGGFLPVVVLRPGTGLATTTSESSDLPTKGDFGVLSCVSGSGYTDVEDRVYFDENLCRSLGRVTGVPQS